MSHAIQVLGVKTKDYKNEKGAGTLHILQCCTEDRDGSLIVGELLLPKDHPPVAPGFYEASMVVGKDREGRLSFYVGALKPASQKSASPTVTPVPAKSTAAA